MNAGAPTTMNIGETIRNFRLQKALSQGDIEKRTGLLRCYLSRVENGHTIPSLDTLAKIANAMDVPLASFFSDHESDGNGNRSLPQLSDDQVRFLNQSPPLFFRPERERSQARSADGEEDGRQHREISLSLQIKS